MAEQGAAVLLTGLCKNIIHGQLSHQEDVASLKFDVFRDGNQIEHEIVDNLDNAGTFQIVLPVSMRAADGPSINVKFAKTERPVPIGPDLMGFVNNINECRFGHLLQHPLFYRSFVHSQPRMEIPQHFIDHVAGTGDQELYRLKGIAVTIDILNFGVIDAPSNKVIDLGCGCGRVGGVIASVLDPAAGGAYFGFDIWTEGVTWAQENLTKYYPHASFKILGGHDGYDAHVSYRIDLPDASQDAAIATSVFTHLRAKPANDYAAEIARILRPGGKAYTTFFASKDVYRSFNMPQPAEEDEYAINFVNVHQEDTFTDEDRVVEMFERYGLKVLGVKYGNWRGGR
ncbi:MAG: class I SAM-dependent methyltransferase, partial [Candidatus Acidiferrum sp.]